MQERGLPYISVMTDPTMGGVSASLAMLGVDGVHIAFDCNRPVGPN